MENTGRIRTAPARRIREILLTPAWDDGTLQDLRAAADVDRAHVTMLVEAGILHPAPAGRLVCAIEDLRKMDFAPLRERPSSRGLYLLYEDYLIEREGHETGGILQTGRSRNDWKAAIQKIRFRQCVASLVREVLRLIATLARSAQRHAGAVMPLYTHYHPAAPTTYGHYLAGIGEALGRDCRALLGLFQELEACPLGAGPGSGATLPLRCNRVASLLGFRRGPAHSIDAVAARDVFLRGLAGAAILGVTLSRYATDLLLWSTGEFGFLYLPDCLVGSSSAMPQKRNPFVLEHIQGHAGALLGAFTAAASAMHATPYTNSVAVGSDAVEHVWSAFRKAQETVELTRLMTQGAQPKPQVMRERTLAGVTHAAEMAQCLAMDNQMDFRTAHRLVGDMITHTLDRAGGWNAAESASYMSSQGLPSAIADILPDDVAAASKHGGGAGALGECLAGLKRRWLDQARTLRTERGRWLSAKSALDAAAANLAGRRVRTAVYFFCDDPAIDPVASRAFAAVHKLADLREIGVRIDGRPVLEHVDAARNRHWFVRTSRPFASREPEYFCQLGIDLGHDDFVGVITWHGGANAPDRIWSVHTIGDVVAGVYTPANPQCMWNLLHAARRLGEVQGPEGWIVLAEATHWDGSLSGADPEILKRCSVPMVDIELGSTPESWSNADAASVLVGSLLDVFHPVAEEIRNVLCVGGAHFEQAYTDAVFHDQFSCAVTHALPARWLESGAYHLSSGRDRLTAALDSIPAVREIIYHDGLKGPVQTHLRAISAERGIPLRKHRWYRKSLPAAAAAPSLVPVR